MNNSHGPQPQNDAPTDRSITVTRSIPRPAFLHGLALSLAVAASLASAMAPASTISAPAPNAVTIQPASAETPHAPDSPGPAVYVYDLRYATGGDPRDPDHLRRAWDHAHLVAALQGLVNRDAPRLYVLAVMSQVQRNRCIDAYWLDYLQQQTDMLAGRPIRTIADIDTLVQTFRPFVRGLVVYDPNVAATSNVASAVAGAEDLLPVRYDPRPDSLYHRLTHGPTPLPIRVRLVRPDGRPLFTGTGTIPGTSEPTTGSAKCDAYLWMKHHYLDTGRCTGRFGAYYIDQYWRDHATAAVFNHHCLTNHDFFIARRAFFFDLHVWPDEPPVDDPAQKPGTDRRTLQALLASAYEHGGREHMIHVGGFVPWAYKYTNRGRAGGKHPPVPTEWEYGRILSAYNGFMDADAISFGAMANASFFMHFPLRDRYPQSWPTPEDLAERGYLTPDGRVDFRDRDFVVFYVGDYDCAAWLYQRIPDIWDDPSRGRVPMMWAIGPHLACRAPMAMHYIRTTATPDDYFVAADNGSGYCEPGMLQEPRSVSGLPSGLDAWVAHCRADYARWGLTITGFIIYGHGPQLNAAGLDAYAAFSPNGIVPSAGPPTRLHRDMPVLRFDHDIMESDPARAAEHVLQRIRQRRRDGLPPFHWFRNVLKTPTWYVAVRDELARRQPTVELLDAPTFFELFRVFLRNHPDHAAGRPPR